MAYESTADADAYFSTTFRGAEWALLDAADKDIGLAEASRDLDTLCYHGTRCQEDQPHEWPREVDPDECCCSQGADCTDNPPEVTQAVCELALIKYQQRGQGLATQEPAEVQSKSLEGLSISYFQRSSRKINTRAPLVLQQHPWLVDTLGCYLQGSYGYARVLSRCSEAC